ncbi:MAG: tRNA (adenosine(37)-N6)-threonylcarbamoyltransferase complex transferase subunit TsaD [Myxococcales bacterium]|nr:tRNA (adenosine(37)-N6)-threonylcarbamoyltransferase complex transferase subunit TsaD [Myxococcales bacterium]MCB9532385.1 tRNA (adenosine(37)-N6)-threonylcarbamoyltransferase complex transferase subunit TsaD [Myxococcales bacterium]
MSARSPLVLAIESSCDETAAAVLGGHDRLLSSVVHSQVELHAQYGGVVPELASRAHVMALPTVTREALQAAGVGPADIEAVVVTQGPGLVGALLCGIEFAKGFAFAHDIPLLGVNHLEGHVMAAFLETTPGFSPPQWPFVGLVVSGGHTSLYACEAPGRYAEVGRTVDDAVGEAYDKVSKLLGMGYPGGAAIDRRAARGDGTALRMPRPMLHKGGADFSFSGLKTAVAQYVEANPSSTEAEIDNLCAAFQEAAVDVLVSKTLTAARRLRYRQVVVAGGVASNRWLRAEFLRRGTDAGVAITVAPPALCTDNAAMIGAAGYARAAAAVASGVGFDAAALDAVATWPLGREV